MFGRTTVVALLAAILGLLAPTARLAAQAPSPPVRTAAGVTTASGAVIQGLVTTQDGTIPLGGALVSLESDRTTRVATVMSEGDGTYRFEGLEAGSYRVTAALDGFDTKVITVRVEYNQTAQASLDLAISGVAERIDVVAPQTIVPTSGTLTTTDVVSGRELEQLSPGGGVPGALRLIASVIEVPGGVAIKGGRPSQATVQIGPSSFVDPATGLSQVRLPDDAIDSVTVLPNPYAVEFGRFSSGLVLIQTRRAGDRWKTRVNTLDPTFRTERGSVLHVTGLAGISPRFETGGPLIKDRLWLQQAVQYRYRSSDVPSRPPDELRRSHTFSSFTRADANLSPRHSLVMLGGLFPAIFKDSNLGTFTPPNATVDLKSHVNTAAVTERSLWSDVVFTETTLEVNAHRTEALPQGSAAMELLPETTNGNFYNRQMRSTTSVQFVETLSGTAQRANVLHLFKAGVDVLHSRFDGSSNSHSVLIRRTDGRLVRQLDFALPTTQAIDSTDVALYAQDRVQPTSFWYVELGARLDRDGVIARTNITPRVGSALLLNSAGTTVLRGGIGLFYERTPSAAGVFTQYEGFVDTRYEAGGGLPAGTRLPFAHTVAPDLHTSRSLTWDLAFDHRLNTNWSLHLGTIDRHGTNELLVIPRVPDEVQGAGTVAALELTSDGRSRYREAEVSLHYTRGTRADINVSYVRSQAKADTNAFTNYFDAVRPPVVGDNAYAAARTDVPHRVLMRSRVLPTPTWLLVTLIDWRTGFQYSTVNASLDFVGPRQVLRFPQYLRFEIGLEHRIRIGKLRPWVGVRADNALQAWLPSDVQANVSSPAFGTFYNSEYRQFRIQFRFQR